MLDIKEIEENMNLRREIEKLIYWYVPVYIIGYFIGSVFSTYYKAIPSSEMELTALGLAMTYFTSNLQNIVIAIWLYNISKKSNQKYIIWALFGLVAHLYAAIIFIILNLLEGRFKIGKDNLENELTKPDL